MVCTTFLEPSKKATKKQLSKTELEKSLHSMFKATNNKLEEKRIELINVKENIAGTADSVDVSDIHGLQTTIQNDIDRLSKDSNAIKASIELIKIGDYGYCEGCGIEIERLNAYPTANKCVDCKSLEELKLKQKRCH